MTSALIINQSPLQLIPDLAKLIGLNDAIILQQVHYWITHRFNKNIFEGRKWVYNTYAQWQEQFPFWCKRTINGSILSLEKKGFLLSYEGEGRLKHYSIDYEVLNRLLEENGHCKICTMVMKDLHDGHERFARSYIDTEITHRLHLERDAREKEPDQVGDVSMSGHFVPTPPQEEFQEDQAKNQISPLNSNWTSLGGAVAKIGQSAKGTSLDINWTLPDRWREWAIELGMMNEEIDLTEVNFRDYWLSKAKDRTKSDWFATWRVWCRKDRENRKLPINLKKSSLSSTPKEPERQTSQRVTGKFKRSDDPRIQKWHDLQATLRDRVGVSNYESWFERDGNIELVKADGKAILKFSSHFYKEYIWKQFSSDIAQTLAEIDPKLGLGENIELIVQT